MHSIFTHLDSLLYEYQPLWRFEPFHHSRDARLPGQSQHPVFCNWITSLSEDEIRNYKACPSLFQEHAEQFLAVASELTKLIILPEQAGPGLKPANGIEKGIPGRKLQQIVSMGDFALNHHCGSGWLEWCSGKGYLGRILASESGEAVLSYEWQPSLCESGQKEANANALPMTFVQGDALSPEASDIPKQEHHAIALHACGDLHVRLMQHASRAGSQAITVSPCCYHLTQDELYQPLSEYGKSSSLKLSRQELRIPLQETVTGGKRVSRHREDEMSFRLGLDLILREVMGLEEYMTVPSIKKSELALGFEHFCRWAADRKQIQLPEIQYSEWEKKGRHRFWEMERLSLIQQVFRRALELWLVYDKALFLEEQGYRVCVSEFCDRKVTPRNIIIHGER